MPEVAPQSTPPERRRRPPPARTSAPHSACNGAQRRPSPETTPEGAPPACLKRAPNGADEAPKRHCNDAITTPGVTTWKRCFHDHQIGAMPPALQRIWRCLQQRCRWRLNAASKSAWTALLMAPEWRQEWHRSSALNGACSVPPRCMNSAFNVQIIIIILFKIH